MTRLRELGNKDYIPNCLEGLAEGARVQGDLGRAARLFGAAEALRLAIGVPLPPVDRAIYEHQVTAARAQIDAAAFAQAWEEGRAMPLEQAIAYALAKEDVAE